MSRLCHWEIPSTDLSLSTAFYAALFGWKMQSWSSDYAMFEVEDGVGGGISKVEKMPEPCIDVYVSVDDIPTALAKAETLGATVERTKTEIGGGMGFYAYLRDPCGCRIGIWAKE
jgi:predicted enzyme related to lactoylglutathione lyase